MVTRRQASAGIVTAAVLAGTSGVGAQEGAIMQLPPPRLEGGKPLMQTLKLRRSIREYADRALSQQVLSDLLWAAFGINRPSGDRTAPNTEINLRGERLGHRRRASKALLSAQAVRLSARDCAGLRLALSRHVAEFERAGHEQTPVNGGY
ncbi:MAG: hypothetical protein WCC81_01065 [Pseudolabrys sp.]